MKQISGKNFVRIATQHGWELKRINGSHHILSSPVDANVSVFPSMVISPSKPASSRHLLKTSGLTEADL